MTLIAQSELQGKMKGNKIRGEPAAMKAFEIEDSFGIEALKYMESAAHFGKIVIVA